LSGVARSGFRSIGLARQFGESVRLVPPLLREMVGVVDDLGDRRDRRILRSHACVHLPEEHGQERLCELYLADFVLPLTQTSLASLPRLRLRASDAISSSLVRPLIVSCTAMMPSAN